jgi:DNA-binding beta-propeller fold protein YncE
MRLTRASAWRTSVAAFALGLLSSCGANVGPIFPTSARPESARDPGSLVRAQTTALLYVSEPLSNAVKVYRILARSQKPIATITKGIDGPAGLAVDGHGNLFVANTRNNTVTEYAPNGSAPVATYSKGLLGPVGVAVDDAGTLYVANFYSFVRSVVAYPSGSSGPSLTIPNPCSCYPVGLALDAQDRLYVAYDDFYAQTIVYRYAQGSTKGTALDLQFGMKAWEAPGLAFDKAGDLLVANASLPGIEVFQSGHKTPLTIFGKRGKPRFLQFDRDERHLFVTDTALHAVEEYSYPAGKLTDVIREGLTSVYGVAISPRAAL